MEEDNIRQLFREFIPDISDTPEFMKRLEERLEIVEMVRKYSKDAQRCNRRAIMIAAIAGFIVGVLFTSLLPQISLWMQHLSDYIHISASADLKGQHLTIATYCLSGFASLLVTISTYGLSLKLMSPKHDFPSESILR